MTDEVNAQPVKKAVSNVNVSMVHTMTPGVIHHFEFSDGSQFDTVTTDPVVPVITTPPLSDRYNWVKDQIHPAANSNPPGVDQQPPNPIPIPVPSAWDNIHAFVKKFEIPLFALAALASVWGLSHWHFL